MGCLSSASRAISTPGHGGRRSRSPAVIGEPQAPPSGAALGRGRSHGGQENSNTDPVNSNTGRNSSHASRNSILGREGSHGGQDSHAESGGTPVTHSRRATAVAWSVVAVLSLAGAVLTVLASGPLVTS